MRRRSMNTSYPIGYVQRKSGSKAKGIPWDVADVMEVVRPYLGGFASPPQRLDPGPQIEYY